MRDEIICKRKNMMARLQYSDRIESLIRGFLKIPVFLYSTIPAAIEKSDAEALGPLMKSVHIKVENDKAIFRCGGYNKEVYLKSIGVVNDCETWGDALEQLYDTALRTGCIGASALRKLAYPLMGKNTDEIMCQWDEFKQEYANLPVESLYRYIGEYEYYEECVRMVDEFCCKKYNLDHARVKDVMYMCWEDVISHEHTIVFDDHHKRVELASVRLYDKSALKTVGPEQYLSNRATWIWDIMVYIPLKLSKDKRYAQRPVPVKLNIA